MKKVMLALLIPAALGQWGCGSAKPVAMETGPYASNKPYYADDQRGRLVGPAGPEGTSSVVGPAGPAGDGTAGQANTQ